MKLNNAPVGWYTPARPVLSGLRQKNCLSKIMWDTLGNTGKTRHNEESKGKKKEQMKPKEK